MAEVIISREISGVVVKSGTSPVVVTNQVRGNTIVSKGERGINGADGADGADGVGGYTDTELSANVTVQSGKSYRTNGVTLITLDVPTNLAEGSFFRVIGVSMDGWEVQFNGSELAKLAGYTNQTSVAGTVVSQYPNDVAEFFKVSSDTWVINSYGVGLT